MNRSRSFGVLIALGFAVSVVMLLVVATVGYFSIARIWNNAHKMGQTYEMIDQLSELSSMVQDAETGQRGYLLTGNDTYLEPYRAADASIDNVRRQLRDLTADNPAQARRLEQALPLDSVQDGGAEADYRSAAHRGPGRGDESGDDRPGQGLDGQA